MNSTSEEQRTLARQGAELLRFPDKKRARSRDFVDRNTVIFVHGFTADASYMEPLAEQFSDEQFSTMIFNYPCFDGIDSAAKTLVGTLEHYHHLRGEGAPVVRVTLVCHSMGGLVARAAVALLSGGRFIERVITLGTPHSGTLQSRIAVRLYARAGEWMGGLSPNPYTSSAMSAKQLIGADDEPGLLKRLQQSAPDESVKYFSVSGGCAWMEFGRSPLRNAIANFYLQNRMSGVLNDGLVPESSSNLQYKPFPTTVLHAQHYGNYEDFPRVNHSNLIRNQQVALRLMLWAKRELSPDQSDQV